jgi:hypothetical protein
MFSNPMNTKAQPARPRLLDEMRNAVTQRVDLQDQPDLEILAFAQFDQAVEDRFPVAVAREVIVGNEKPRNALRRIGANDGFDIVGTAVPRLASLDVDDRAKAALKRTATTGVEAGILRRYQRDHVSRQDRRNRARQVGHAVHIIVDGLCCSGRDIAQDVGHASLGFAGEQMNS